MAGMIIWFVVVMYIVIRCINTSKKNAKLAKPNVPRKQEMVKQITGAQMNRTNPQQRTGNWSGNVQYGRSASQQSRRTAQQQRTTRRPQQENSILQKAKANASRQFDDDTLEARGSVDINKVPLGDEIMKDKAQARHIHSEHELSHQAELKNQAGVDDFDTYHLIDEVNDLIVKGYSGNLKFERDFLSEATDMLKRMYG